MMLLMKITQTPTLTRRQFLKSTGALVVSFNLMPPAAKVLAQFATLPSGDIDPTSLDSCLAITPDGYVTFYTSKVEIGTGTITALGQIVAEELDIPFNKIKMDSGDTRAPSSKAPPSAAGHRRAGRRFARLLPRPAVAQRCRTVGVSADKLTVADGVVSNRRWVEEG
jgi:CO/xanthine dehydrogenase Mo-binding subunit